MSGEGQLTGRGEPVGRLGRPQHAFGAGVVRRVAGLAHPLEVGGGERGAQLLTLGAALDGGLQLGDVGRRPGQHRARDRARRGLAAPEAEDGEARAEREADE